MHKERLKYLYWVLAGTVIVLFIVGLAAFHNLEQARGYSHLVNHTNIVLQQTEQTMALITDAEAGVRGYLLTYNSNFLLPYFHSVKHIRPAVRALDSLTADNQRQNARVRTLQHLATERFEILNQSMSLSVLTTSRTILYNSLLQGKLVMDSIHLVMKQVKQDEQQQLMERERKENEFFALTPFWLGLISLLAVTLFSTSFYVVIQELRRRWRYEGQLEQAVQKLSKANAELESFVYLASHHFQEPLRKLQTISDRLTTKHRHTLQEDTIFLLDRIRDAAGRMQQLMDDLLLYLRFVPYTGNSDFKTVHLPDLLHTLVPAADQAAGVQVETDNTATVTGDPLQLQSLFDQLLDNSVKFARQNVQPVIKIRTFVTIGTDIPGVSTEHADKKFCKIEFSDNGIGFDPTYTEKIFQLFQRLHHSHEYPGTGIGLAICRKVVDNHHGYLHVESQIDMGTTFHIYLPLAHAPDKNYEIEQGPFRADIDGR